MPAASAAVSTEIQAGEITPPRFATPTTSVRTPAAAASASVMSGRPMSALQPSIRSCPIAASGRQSRMPCATLAASGSGASPRNSRYGRLDHRGVPRQACAPSLGKRPGAFHRNPQGRRRPRAHQDSAANAGA